MVVNEEELTFGCGEGGRLIGCTFCFNSAHAECCGLGDQRVNAPRGDWACPACIDHTRDQLKGDSDDGESDDDGESGDDGESDCDGESDEGEDESEEEKSDDSEDDDSDGDENEEESEDSEEEDDDVSVLMNWIQNSNTTIRMLKEKCRSVGLKMNGRKHEVVQRLLNHFN